MCLICLIFLAAVCLMEAGGGLDFSKVPLSAEIQEKIVSDDRQEICGVCSRIAKTDNGLRISIQNANLIIQSEKYPIKNVQVYTEDTQITAGDFILVSGNLSEIEAPGNPGEFNARLYYFCRQYYYRMTNGTILAVRPCSGITRKLSAIQKNIMDTIEKTFLTEAEEANAVFLGERSGIDEEALLRFQMAGLMHVFSISGLHISLIGMGLFSLLKKIRLGNFSAGTASMAVVLMYCVLTNSSISTVRAVTMFMIMAIAKMYGRIYDVLSALAFSALLVLIESPGYLRDSGFLLSYAAVFGIAVLAPVMQSYLCSDSRITRMLCSSLGLQLSMLPVILYFYGEISLTGIFLNLIVLPTVCIVIYSAGAAVLFGNIALRMGMAAALPGRLVLRIYLILSSFPGKIPYSTWIAGAPQKGQILGYYAVLLTAEFLTVKIVSRRDRQCRQTRWKKIFRGISLAVFSAGLLLFLTFRPDRNSVTMLDIGQGDCCVIQTETGQCFMVDGGSSSRSNIAERVILPFLKHQGIDCVNGIFISHTDEDHINGIEDLLEMKLRGLTNLRIGCLVLPAWEEKDAAYRKMEELAEELEIPVKYVEEGESLKGKKIRFSILAPFQKAGDPTGSDANEDSMVMQCELSGIRILFTGDIGTETEKALLDNGSLQDIDILKTAHHGSKFSSSEAFLQRIRPELSVISCAAKNRYGHPSKETVERISAAGSRIEYTMNSGAITIEITMRGSRSLCRLRRYKKA